MFRLHNLKELRPRWNRARHACRGQRCVSIFVSDGNHQREVSSEPLHLGASVRQSLTVSAAQPYTPRMRH